MINKAASKAALDEIVSELVAAKATHSGGRLRNHLSIAHRSLVVSGVHITKDALKKRVSRAILARKSAEEIVEVEAVNSPSSAVSSLTVMWRMMILSRYVMLRSQLVLC